MITSGKATGGKRWLWLSPAVLILALGAGWLLFRPRATLPELPVVPADLTLADFGLDESDDGQATPIVTGSQTGSLAARPVVDPGNARAEYEAGLKLVDAGEVDEGLARMEAAVRSSPQSLHYANAYRMTIIRVRRYSRSVEFFETLVKTVDAPETRLQLALAYVDKMAECPAPPNGMVCQAKLSNQSISELDHVLGQQPYNVMALYGRGMNNLYWPYMMGRLPQSVADLSTCVAIEQTLPGGARPFSALSYVALGDALVKDGNTEQGFAVWQEGLDRFPESTVLRDRVALDRSLAVEEVRRIRGLGVFVDTDLSIFRQTRGSK